jgi:multicomponent Na+:H+ antiporter subunit B
MKNASPHLVLRVVAKSLIPFIALYALYVHFHGEYSPGGGFQGGVILAASVILYGLIFGVDAARRAIPPWFVRGGCALGVLIYGGTGVLSLMMGGNYLDYDVLVPGSAHFEGQHYGIIAVEVGVIVSVASVMVAIYYAFSGRSPEVADEDW